MKNNMYSVRQVAELLNVTPPTIRNWVANDKLKAIVIGTTMRFKKDYIDQILEA